MFIYESSGILYLVIEDATEGETHLDLAGDFDGNSLMRVYANGRVDLANEMKTGESVREFFGVTE